MFSRMRHFLAFLLILLPATAISQEVRRPSHCIAIAEADPALQFVHKASFKAPLPDEFTVRLSYIDHAMFLLETHGGLTAVTDYVGYIGATELVPDVVTMNRAHGSHYTANPDPLIPHVLPGWNDTPGMPAGHHLDLGEMLVRSVSTDIRGIFDDSPVEVNGNSIFVFEVGGLCIGHLGHLHHEPDDRQYASLGRLDVVMAPVDGGMTLDLPTMVRVLSRLRSSIVIPMHWFGVGSLERFLMDIEEEGTFLVERDVGHHLEVSLRTLPSRPTVKLLWPRYLSDRN